MVKIVSADGVEKDVDCIGCALQNGEIECVGEKIAETENFDVQQDYEIPIPGFMILASKKHLKGIEDFSEGERKEFIEFLYKIRKAMTDVLKVEYVYIIQEEDSIDHGSHFHVWLFPRYDWMKEKGIKHVRDIMEYARNEMKTKENLAIVKEKTIEIKKILEKN